MINDNNFSVILFQTSSNSKTLPVHINNGASRLVFISFMIITSIKNGGDRDVRSYIESDEKVCIEMNTLSHASGVCAVISHCCQPLKRKGKIYV
jgi:hypothetical protein